VADPTRATQPLAVVGLACRFPDADDPAALLDVVLTGRRAFRRLPQSRIEIDDYYLPDLATSDATYSTRAAVIEGWRFDPAAFGIDRPPTPLPIQLTGSLSRPPRERWPRPVSRPAPAWIAIAPA
jgi:hypothetical protein